jgi:hypothetical protein
MEVEVKPPDGSGSATDSGLMRKREETGGLGEIWVDERRR